MFLFILSIVSYPRMSLKPTMTVNCKETLLRLHWNIIGLELSKGCDQRHICFFRYTSICYFWGTDVMQFSPRSFPEAKLVQSSTPLVHSYSGNIVQFIQHPCFIYSIDRIKSTNVIKTDARPFFFPRIRLQDVSFYFYCLFCFFFASPLWLLMQKAASRD